MIIKKNNNLIRREGKEMILATLDSIPEKKVIKTLGMVRGSCVKAKHIGKDIIAVLKNIVGGELKGYEELMNEAREAALERLVKEAEKMGANAIIGIRFATSSIMSGASEILAYGTAVIIE